MQPKNIFLSSAVALIAISGALYGQESSPPPGPPPAYDQGSGAPHRGRPGMMMERLKEKLGLSDDQAKQVAAIFKDEMKEGKAIRGDASLSDDERFAKIRELRKAGREKVRAILTPDQQKIFDALPPPGARRWNEGQPPPEPPPT